eukprot:957130-Lingulodinium_polyedra.AAC.1
MVATMSALATTSPSFEGNRGRSPGRGWSGDPNCVRSALSCAWTAQTGHMGRGSKDGPCPRPPHTHLCALVTPTPTAS